MAFERSWAAVPARLFTTDGSQYGLVTVGKTRGFRVKMVVVLSADTLPDLSLQVKQVLNPTQIIVGLIDQKIPGVGADIRAYTVALNATVSAAQQKKNDIPEKDHYSAIYEADPVVADRVIGVDENGDFYNEENPLPVLPGGEQIVPNEFDEVIIERDGEDYPIEYQFLLESVQVGHITVEYNANKSAVRYKGFKP